MTCPTISCSAPSGCASLFTSPSQPNFGSHFRFRYSAVAACINLPIVVIHGRQFGFGAFFYVSLAHWLLYMFAGAVGARSWPKPSAMTATYNRQEMDVFDTAALRAPPSIFSRRWRGDVARLIRLLLPHRTVWAVGLCAQLVAAPISSLCLIVIGRAFNGFYLPVHGGELRGQLRTYCCIICVSYLAASIADACAYTMFRMAGDALACRLRRRVLHCTMHRDLHELAQGQLKAGNDALVKDVPLLQQALSVHLPHALQCLLTACIVLYLMFVLSWKLTAVTIALAPLCILAAVISSFITQALKANRVAADERAASIARLSLQAHPPPNSTTTFP